MSCNTRLRVQLVLYNVTEADDSYSTFGVTSPHMAVYISSTRFPALSEFTVCTWIKPAEYDDHQQSGMLVGRAGFFIHAYHTGESSNTDLITMVYHHSDNSGLLVFAVNMWSSASMSVPNFLSNSWKHICGRWDSEAHDTFVHYLDSEDGSGDYLSASGPLPFTVQSIAAGTAGGSMVLFHRQTGGPALSAAENHPLGTLGYDDSTIGSIASFQFFSVYLPEKVFSLLGCGGLRADIFDSFYDDYEYMGEGIGYTIEQKETPYCSASSDKWFGAPLSDTFNCLQTDEVTNTVFRSFYAKNKVLCAAICFKVPQCDSFNYEELDGTCQLSSLIQILFPCEGCVPGFAANTVQMCTSIHGVNNKESIDNLLSIV